MSKESGHFDKTSFVAPAGSIVLRCRNKGAGSNLRLSINYNAHVVHFIDGGPACMAVAAAAAGLSENLRQPRLSKD